MKQEWGIFIKNILNIFLANINKLEKIKLIKLIIHI